MKEDFQKFFEQLSTDSALREEFAKQPSLEAAYAVATEVTPALTQEEFTARLEELSQAAGEKLTDEELEKVGGGMAVDGKFWWIPCYGPFAMQQQREEETRRFQDELRRQEDERHLREFGE